MNLALLAKLNWRLRTCHNITWCNVMKAKYDIRKFADPISKPVARSSYIWKVVVWSAEPVQKGVTWQVRNEKDARFCSDIWLEEVPLKDLAIHPLNADLLLVKVYKYRNSVTGWRWSDFSQFLPSSTLLKMSSVILSYSDEANDVLGWRPSSTGSLQLVSQICAWFKSRMVSIHCMGG